MTRQEVLRAGLRTAILENTQVNTHRGVVFTITGLSNILTYLQSQGAVLKVEKELPENAYPLSAAKYNDSIMDCHIAYERAQKDMVGYEAVEPLIEVKQ